MLCIFTNQSFKKKVQKFKYHILKKICLTLCNFLFKNCRVIMIFNKKNRISIKTSRNTLGIMFFTILKVLYISYNNCQYFFRGNQSLFVEIFMWDFLQWRRKSTSPNQEAKPRCFSIFCFSSHTMI